MRKFLAVAAVVAASLWSSLAMATQAAYSVIVDSTPIHGGTVTSSWDWYNTKGRVIDGGFTGPGWASGAGNTYPLALIVTFDSPHLINSLTVVSVNDHPNDSVPPAYGESFSLHGVTDYDVYVRTDTNVDVLVASVRNNTWVARTSMFAPVMANAAYINILGSHSDSGVRQLMAGLSLYEPSWGYAPQIWPLDSQLNYASATPQTVTTGGNMGFATLAEATEAYTIMQAKSAQLAQAQAQAGIPNTMITNMRIQPAGLGSMIPIGWYSGPAYALGSRGFDDYFTNQDAVDAVVAGLNLFGPAFPPGVGAQLGELSKPAAWYIERYAGAKAIEMMLIDGIALEEFLIWQNAVAWAVRYVGVIGAFTGGYQGGGPLYHQVIVPFYTFTDWNSVVGNETDIGGSNSSGGLFHRRP